MRRYLGAILMFGIGVACGKPATSETPHSNGPAATATENAAPVTIPSATPPASGEPEAKPVTEPANDPPSPFAGPAIPKNPNDLSWLVELAQKLADEPVTRPHVIAFLGSDAGGDGSGGFDRRKVRAHSQHLTNVAVYALPHIHVEVAVDIEFAENSRPGRSAVEKAIGPLKSMPRAPDAMNAGPKFAANKSGKRANARVFVELDPKDNSRVKGVHVDAEPNAQ